MKEGAVEKVEGNHGERDAAQAVKARAERDLVS